VEMFAGNPDVSFGDIVLTEAQIRGPPHNPGSGGWPTIRYFNKETGVDGASYEKKTEKSMCDELGNIENMMAYIEDKGKTSLCNIETKAGCNEKQSTFIDKFKSESKEKLKAELERLTNLAEKPMKPDLKVSVVQRQNILKKLIELPAREEL